jgi:tetratricopeptide (TPR) repeat protein
VAIAFAAENPVQAQTNERLTILTPAFAAKDGAKGNFGKDVAKEFNKLLGQYVTHAPADDKTIRDALRKFQLKEEQLSEQGSTPCLPARQLALQVDVDLVLCGTFTGAPGAYKVDALVISPSISEEYQMPQITAVDAKDAAAKVSQEFQTFIDGLKVAVFCQDYAASQNWPSAIENCNKALAMNPKNKGATHALGVALWKSAETAPEAEKKGLLERAKATFKRVIEIDPVAQDAMMLLGVVTVNLGNTDEAMNYFREYLNLNPGDVRVRLTVAGDAAKAGGYEAALRILEDGMTNATGTELTDLQTYAGTYAMQAAFKKMQESGKMNEVGDAAPLVEKGVQYLTKVYQTQGENADPAAVRSVLTGLRLLGRLDEAQTFGNEALAKPAFAKDAGLWSTLADVLSQAGKKQEAIAALDKAAQIDPKVQLADYRRALWYLDMEDIDATAAAVQKGLQAATIDAAQADQVAQRIAFLGYNKGRASGASAGMPYYEAAEKIAGSDVTKGMIAYFRGNAIYGIAVEREKAETKESATAALPMFQQVVNLMQQAAPYGATNPQIEASRTTIITNARAYIDREQAIIKRGR